MGRFQARVWWMDERLLLESGQRDDLNALLRLSRLRRFCEISYLDVGPVDHGLGESPQ